MTSNINISYGTLDDLKVLFAKDPSRSQFIDAVQRYLRQWNESHPQPYAHTSFVPIVNGKYLDIFELFNQVQFMGGFESVNKDQKWPLIAARLGFPSLETSNLIVQTYSSLLLAFEQSVRSGNKPALSNTTPSSHAQPQSHTGTPMVSTLPNKINYPNLPRPNLPTLSAYHPPANPNSMQVPAPAPVVSSSLTANLINKRPRPNEMNIHGNIPSLGSENFVDRMNVAVRELNAKDPAVIVKGLNYLTQKSFEMTDNNAIQVELCPHLLISLGELLNTINPITACLFPMDVATSFTLSGEEQWSLTTASAGKHDFKVRNYSSSAA
jgi:hypothetical protein